MDITLENVTLDMFEYLAYLIESDNKEHNIELFIHVKDNTDLLDKIEQVMQSWFKT